MEKTALFSAISAVFGIFSTMLGGWDSALSTLCIFMLLDYLTGLIVGGVFKKSSKTKTGALESRAGLKGIFRKCSMLTVVLIASQVDALVGESLLKDCTVIMFICNESLSLLENIGLMGVPIPQKLIDAIDVLTQKEGKDAHS